MTTYAIAHLQNVRMGQEIVDYLNGIDATLAPFGGAFVLHGAGNRAVLEGNFEGDLVMIAFPDRPSAEAWYASPAYQKILPLRTENATGPVLLVDGVDPGHRGRDLLAKPSGKPRRLSPWV